MVEEFSNSDIIEECDVCKNYIPFSKRSLKERIKGRIEQFQERSTIYSDLTSKHGFFTMCDGNFRTWTVWANDGRKCVEKYNNQKCDKIHHAIIIVNNDDKFLSFSKNTPTYAGGIDLLINYFVKNPITPFQIYVCKDPKSFETAIKNPNTKFLWIFGHGDRHCVDFGNRIYFPYCRLSGALQKNKDLKKDFIAQLHCSSGDGLPIWKYLSDNEGIYSGKDRYPLQNREDIMKWIQQKPKKITTPQF
jgi:hypothetical protein